MSLEYIMNESSQNASVWYYESVRMVFISIQP